MASSHQLKFFDVFLSFRGEDTRRGFVSHLYKALTQHGIRTFVDDNLCRGENISEELLKVIENSSASIIVLSKNYASSGWYLDELAKIIECTKKVLPVFYQVDPSEVRKQRGDLGKALTKVGKKIKDKTKVQRWRDALNKAANISGWDDKNSCTESELVQKIVEEILNSKFIQMPSNVAAMQLVGINSHIEAVTKLLDIESNDVRMVGITGLGGIGKTTIAKAIYNRFSNHFKAKSFVENVREWSKTEQGKIRLQETLLKGISEDKNLSVDTIYEGSTRINKILCLKKVLIILDDVDNADQIETLLGQCEGFAFQSRIILTTRNKRLLANRNGLSTYDYEVKELDEYEAIELFRKHAFPSNEVPEDYLELEKQAISYAKGLPLALVVVGRDLCEKPIQEWDDALDFYKTNQLEDIRNVLKRSYEGLTENERNIFLDIACFFKGYDMSYNMIKDVLKACGLDPISGIQNLIDKCLLTIDQNNYYLSMHDLLQQMGMDIVRQEAPQKPGERSRLWCYEEVLDVLTNNMGSDKIRSIILWSPKLEPEEVQLKAQFCKMKNLRLLLIFNVRCCNGPPECLPNGLSLLDWLEYPFSSWPPNFFPKNLVVLNMPFILLKEPVLKQILVSLTYVDFSDCDLIRKIPDLMTPNIKSFILNWCTNLVEIDDSVGRLDKLEVWNLYGCVKLETLPNCLTMKSLTYFNLKACKRIKKFPNILHEMKGVEYLHLQGNCTNELPPSFGNLIGLKGLSISSNSGEAHLPGSIYNLQHIEWLDFSGNVIFPKNVEIDRQPMCNSLGGSSKYVFPMLKQLKFIGFKIHSEIEFILNYCCPLTLEELEIYYSEVVTLPESISRCERLHMLVIRDCNEFQEIPRLPHSIRHVEVTSCHSLDLQSFFQLLPEIIGLPPNLPPCLGVTSHMLMFPHSSTMLPIRQNCFCEYSLEVTGDEDDIPNWFNHQRDGNLISFSIGPEFPTIALCIAFGIQDSHCNIDYHVVISINGSERTFEKNFIEKDWSFGHLSFSCRPQSSLQELFWDLQLTDRNHVEILCETFHIFQEIAPIVERIGVHVECNCPPPQNPSIFQDINRHLSLQSGRVLSSPEISKTEESGECEEETDADIETTLKAEGITPEQDESNKKDPSPSLFSVEKYLLTLTQGAGESSLSTSQDPVEYLLPMSQTPNSRNEADVLTNTWSNQDGVQDLSFESIKVSEISELMDFASRVHSLKIEECDDLEFIPQGEVPSSPVIKKSKGISEAEEIEECEDEIDADIETTLKAKGSTPAQDESKEEDPSPILFLEQKSSLPLTQGAGESSLPMSQTPNSRNEADVLTNTWSNQDGLQDLSFESIKVSEISELEDLPRRVHSLKIEGCDDLEFIPKEVMSCELSLQDLYIINCCSLKSFHNDHPPPALKILYIRNCKKLNFPLTTEMKTHQDALLEYLCIGSSCDSLKSISLDLFPNLKSLSIWDCANLELLSMPVQKNLTSLEALEIRDCPNLVSFLGGGLCTMNLTSVWLSNCKKLEKLPELHTLDSLQSMFINNCPELVSLSEKGLPSRLSLLSITFCNKLKLKDEWGLDGLDYLRRLEIEGGCVDVGSFPEKFLPSNLSSLRISGLLNLKNLDNKGFQQLTTLQRLEISCCPNLQSFPEDGFPSSLSFLCIKECPLLTSKFRNRKGKDWSKIDHISCIEIDEEVIS